jgi:hypothetical protein
MKRKDVYKLIDEEREYQDDKWGPDKQNSIEAWLVYIEDYLNATKHEITKSTDIVTYGKAKCNIRKIAAMAVCAMEQLNVMSREQEEQE